MSTNTNQNSTSAGPESKDELNQQQRDLPRRDGGRASDSSFTAAHSAHQHRNIGFLGGNEPSSCDSRLLEDSDQNKGSESELYQRLQRDNVELRQQLQESRRSIQVRFHINGYYRSDCQVKRGR